MLYHNKVSNKWLYSCEPACLKNYFLKYHDNLGVPAQYSLLEWHKGCCSLFGEIFILENCFQKWSKNLKLNNLPGNISKWHYVKWKLIQAEFKLGFIAQSCLAPGFRWGVHFMFYICHWWKTYSLSFCSSMMSNLFAMRADLSSPEMKQWQNEYLQVKSL